MTKGLLKRKVNSRCETAVGHVVARTQQFEGAFDVFRNCAQDNSPDLRV